MHHEVEIEGRVRKVAIDGSGGRFAVQVDGRTWQVDAARIDAHTLSLIVDSVSPEGDGRTSYDVAISPDGGSRFVVQVGARPLAVTFNGPRRARDAGSQTGAGPQRIVAPMPGKIVRVLVRVGDSVRTRQPLVVVEAMKMENEIRAGRDGSVAGIHVEEGASVEAGALLVEMT